jgi:ATP-binding protein involved in chromosome partitioning
MESSVPKGVTSTPHPHGAAPKEKLPGIRHVIAVASGKGGVGKSTVSVNLALALQQAGAQAGLIDADILGPSIPVMLGVPRGQPPAVNTEGRAIPTQPYGLRVISMGMLTGDDAPAILRGPMVTKYLQMFLGGVAWGKLDYLILDLPPGTGDTQLTLAQSTPLSGAIIVTTPQDVSLAIARRGLRMFEKVQVPILGIVENMSTFLCPHCGERTDIFRHGGGAQMSKDLGVPFLGEIPLDANIVTSGDEGRPILVSHPESTAAQAYRAIAKRLSAQLDASVSAVIDAFVWNWDDDRSTPGWFDTAASANGSRTTPVGFGRRDPRTLSVLWQDGRRDDLDVRDVRLACMCALCVQEMSGKKILDPKTVRTDVAPRTITSVGTYAVTIAWNDGHGSGIYSFEHLRSLGDASKARASYDV